MVFSHPFRLWLLPSFGLLAAMAAWGAVRYPRLPDRIPGHFGLTGVDAWTDRSVGSAFVMVFLYAGLTLVMAGSAELSLRLTPRDELAARGGAPFALHGPASTASSLVNRPASRVAARRIARSLLVMNLCFGVAFLAGGASTWYTAPGQQVPWWLTATTFAMLLFGIAHVLVVALRNRK
ncbi:DUF1648 domain-containing protein [Streptomyces sp. ODS28]|uniref:DUF1648 domain-containing protein n=1 Tax=Streptomyces sp. ODS28 TaxID=3136688 RepID=UPI0031EF86D3